MRTDIATLDAELEAEAQAISAYVGAPESKKLSINRDGQWVSPAGVVLGDSVDVIVLDFCSSNKFYTKPYDPKNPEPPVCWAVDRVIADMAPSEKAPEPQASSCAVCPKNQFGSRGNGKACKNTRELAVVLASDVGMLADGETPEIFTMSLPPTALKSFDGAVAMLAKTYKAPPIKFILTASVQAAGAYNTVSFGIAHPNENYRELAPLRDLAAEIISREPEPKPVAGAAKR